MTRRMRMEVIVVYKITGKLGSPNYSLLQQRTRCICKGERPADERKYFPFLHNTLLIYKTHERAGCSQEQWKIQKALGTYIENESTGTFH